MAGAAQEPLARDHSVTTARSRTKYPIGRRVRLFNRSNPNNIDFANTDKVMAFDVVSEATSLEGNTVPDVLNPNEPTMALDPAQATKTRASTSSVPVVSGRSTARDGRTSNRAASGPSWPSRLSGPSRPGTSQRLRRLAPPHPHPPGRHEDPRPESRPGAADTSIRYEVGPKDVSTSAERTGSRDRPVRSAQRAVHDALSQLGARRPLDDAPVQGPRPSRPGPDHPRAARDLPAPPL